MIFRRILKIIFYLLILLLVGFSILILKIYNQSVIDDAQKADAIVVLGASQWNGNPSPIFKARLDHVFVLYKNNYASKIILTGGVAKKESISESMVGKNYLIQKGVEEKVIHIEEQGHTSWQSLNQTAQILKEQNLNSIILISDGFHMMRLKKMATDLGIKSFTSPAIDSPVVENKIAEFKYILREVVIYLGYLLFRV